MLRVIYTHRRVYTLYSPNCKYIDFEREKDYRQTNGFYCYRHIISLHFIDGDVKTEEVTQKEYEALYQQAISQAS